MSTSATLLQTNATEAHVPTVSAYFAPFVETGAGAAPYASEVDMVALVGAFNALLAEIRDNRQMVSAS